MRPASAALRSLIVFLPSRKQGSRPSQRWVRTHARRANLIIWGNVAWLGLLSSLVPETLVRVTHVLTRCCLASLRDEMPPSCVTFRPQPLEHIALIMDAMVYRRSIQSVQLESAGTNSNSVLQASMASTPTNASSMRPVPCCARSCVFTTDSSFGPLRLSLGGYLFLVITSSLLALFRIVVLRLALRRLSLLGHLRLHQTRFPDNPLHPMPLVEDSRQRTLIRFCLSSEVANRFVARIPFCLGRFQLLGRAGSFRTRTPSRLCGTWTRWPA